MNHDFLAIYIVLQIIAFVLYGVDKYKAQKKLYRLSEKLLLGIAILAPFGAYMGMHVFRHKTQKIYFWAVTIFMIVIHAAAAMLYVYWLKM
ncbi:DUF1294 domain-containing protein [Clostridiales bacterium COT073_COT-073]|nr:DUF1294 domain-containing protein [Clostridiales bacterium COT073_COT-073]